MNENQREILEAHSVSLKGSNAQIQFRPGSPRRIEFEPYCELRGGVYQVEKIGAFSYMGGGDTHLRNVASIGRFCAIASNIIAGQVEHPTDFLSPHPILQGGWGMDFPATRQFVERNRDMVNISRHEYLDRYADRNTKITIGNDVWIGEGVFIRRGVSIGDGAVIAARSVVVRDVEPYTIVGGVPARPIRKRFDDKLVKRLLDLQWWDYGLALLDGIDFRDPEGAVGTMEERVARGDVLPYMPKPFIFANMEMS